MASDSAAPSGTVFLKTEQAKKVEFMKEVSQLKIKIQNFEREKATHIYHKHGEFYKDFTQLQELEIKSTSERKSEKMKIQQQLTAIGTKVKQFHRELQSVKPTPEFVEKLKAIMEDIEENISQFKEQQRQLYEEIMKEERITSQEILAIEKKIEMWGQQGAAAAGLMSANTKPMSVVANMDVTKDLPPEVAAFERFVAQNGGVKGGWDDYDHNTFLRFRVKHKGKMTFIRELIPMLPTRSEQEVIEHERWYQQYLDLNEEKKEAIQKWKEKREEEKEAFLAQAEDESELMDEDEEVKRMKEEKLKQVIEYEKSQRRMQLSKWKVDKELEKAEEEERRLREELEKSKKLEREKAQNEENRKKVEEFKRKREEEKQRREIEEAMKERVEEEIKRERAKHNIVKFQSRDLQSVKKKQEKDRAKELEEKQKAERLKRLKETVEVSVQRDPSRLLKPTQGWKERQKAPEAPVGRVLFMPHKAVPSWRQGMS